MLEYLLSHKAYTHKVISTSRKLFKDNLVDILKNAFTLAVLGFWITPWGVNNAQLLLDSKAIRLLETPRSLIEFILVIIVFGTITTQMFLLAL